MIQKALEFIQTQKRPEKLLITERGKYGERNVEAIYSDANGSYSVKSPANNITNVKSVTAFQQFIKEELKRRKNVKGTLSTLQIDINGGLFVADDDFNEGICKYARVLSQQWDLLTGINGKVFSHEDFLAVLVKLSPSIVDFNKTYSQFLKLRIIGKSEMLSAPVFVQGEAKSGYMCEYKIDGTKAETTIPDSLVLQVPYAKASTVKYELPVEIQLLNSGSDRITIKVNIPTLENVEETAILDEVKAFKKELTDCTEMLVLSDI